MRWRVAAATVIIAGTGSVAACAAQLDLHPLAVLFFAGVPLVCSMVAYVFGTQDGPP